MVGIVHLYPMQRTVAVEAARVGPAIFFGDSQIPWRGARQEYTGRLQCGIGTEVLPDLTTKGIKHGLLAIGTLPYIVRMTVRRLQHQALQVAVINPG